MQVLSRRRDTRIQYVRKNISRRKIDILISRCTGCCFPIRVHPANTRCSIWQLRNPYDREQHARVNSRVLRKRRRDGRICKQRSSSSSSSVIDSVSFELHFVIQSYDSGNLLSIVSADLRASKRSLETRFGEQIRLRGPLLFLKYDVALLRRAYFRFVGSGGSIDHFSPGAISVPRYNSERMENLGNSNAAILSYRF